MKAFLTLQHGNKNLGTLHLELYDKDVPKTVLNFTTLLQRRPPSGKGYLGCPFHRIIRGFMGQTGDFTNGDGTGGECIFDNTKTFADENFRRSHVDRGTLSMANSGPGTNGSQFFITFQPTPHLDRKHVVFGRVDLTQSAATLDALERVPTNKSTDQPLQPVTIVDCGVVLEAQDEHGQKQAADDENEIDLEDEEEDEEHEEKIDPPPEDEEDGEEEEPVPKTKAEALKQRMRKLKLKMNQARQLNQQAVKQEGESRNQQGAADRRRQHAAEKKRADAAWNARNSKALQTAEKYRVDGKDLTQQASSSIQQAQRKSEKAEASRFSSRDYHNPEGQHRNYERSLKSLSSSTLQHTTTAASTTATFNPLEHETDAEQERQGAQRLAAELHRRNEKRTKSQLEQKRKNDEADGDGALHINKRNKIFNQKITRTYDQQTREIRDNLERGTAL